MDCCHAGSIPFCQCVADRQGARVNSLYFARCSRIDLRPNTQDTRTRLRGSADEFRLRCYSCHYEKPVAAINNNGPPLSDFTGRPRTGDVSFLGLRCPGNAPAICRNCLTRENRTRAIGIAIITLDKSTVRTIAAFFEAWCCGGAGIFNVLQICGQRVICSYTWQFLRQCRVNHNN